MQLGDLFSQSECSPNTQTWFNPRRYTPRELYSVVANVPSYNQFIPFCTSSSILDGKSIRPEETFEVDAELKVGFMGFSEGYVSKVKGVPFQSVEVSRSVLE